MTSSLLSCTPSEKMSTGSIFSFRVDGCVSGVGVGGSYTFIKYDSAHCFI